MANSKYLFIGDFVRIKSPPPHGIKGSVVEVQGNLARVGKEPKLARWVALGELQLCMLGPRHFATYLLDGREDGWRKTERWFAKYSALEIQNRIFLRLGGTEYMQNVLVATEAASYPRQNLRYVAELVYLSLDDQMKNGYFVVEDNEQAA